MTTPGRDRPRRGCVFGRSGQGGAVAEMGTPSPRARWPGTRSSFPCEQMCTTWSGTANPTPMSRSISSRVTSRSGLPGTRARFLRAGAGSATAGQPVAAIRRLRRDALEVCVAVRADSRPATRLTGSSGRGSSGSSGGASGSSGRHQDMHAGADEVEVGRVAGVVDDRGCAVISMGPLQVIHLVAGALSPTGLVGSGRRGRVSSREPLSRQSPVDVLHPSGAEAVTEGAARCPPART